MSNKKVMSIAIRPDLQDEVKKYAKRKGMSASSYIGMICEKVVKLNIDDEVMVFGKPVDEDVKVVVLKIPCNLRSDPEALKSWMDVQLNGIVGKLTHKEE